MKRTVVKFGGSNLKSKSDISKLINVIDAYNRPIVIVISALFGITDILSDAIEKVVKDRKYIVKLKEIVEERHFHIVDMYIDNKTESVKIKGRISRRVEELNNYLLGTHYFGEIPDFAKDMVLSFGERLSSLLLVSILNFKDKRSIEILPEKLGLITDGIFQNSSVNFFKSESKVKKSINDIKNIIVVPGFYGISESGKVTLLGRGGTDYSASAIARCIKADSVDIWKDVEGFMSIDPKLFNDAISVTKLSYTEAAELSYFGAKILHPRTFEPLIDRGIPIRIFNINKFTQNLTPVTVIKNGGEITKSVVKSVTSSDDFGILKLEGPRVGIMPGIMAEITTALSCEKINIKSIITSQTSINILLSMDDLKKSCQIITGLQIISVEHLFSYDKLSLIAVVGEGMLTMPGIAAKVFTAVSEQGINVSIISAGASPVATYFVVDRTDKERSIKAIHDVFFKI